MRFIVKIENSRVATDCHIQSYDPRMDFSVEHYRALELSRVVVDCLAFQEGIGFTVILEEIVSPAGVVGPLVMQNPKLAALATVFKVPPHEIWDIHKIVIQDASLFAALNELIVAITVPGLVAVNCGRALDGLRQMITPADDDRIKGWINLQEALNLERSYREFVMKNSIKPRHADRTDIPKDVTQEILERSWVIMNRFIEYRKRGSKRLPVNEFEILR